MSKKEKLFVKIYIDEWKGGFLSTLSKENTETLMALCLYIDKDGYCYPSLKTLAYELGVCQSTASNRISELCKVSYKGEWITVKTTQRRKRRGNGQLKFFSNEYYINPRFIKIFNEESKAPVDFRVSAEQVDKFAYKTAKVENIIPAGDTVSSTQVTEKYPYLLKHEQYKEGVSKGSADDSVSCPPETGEHETNKNQLLTRSNKKKEILIKEEIDKYLDSCGKDLC